jgi:hypothetical protein
MEAQKAHSDGFADLENLYGLSTDRQNIGKGLHQSGTS